MKKLIFSFALFITASQVLADFKLAINAYEAGDYKVAITEFQLLAELGNTDAQYNLGMMYLDGLGTKQDLVKAYAWIKLSDEESKDKDTQSVLVQISQHFKDNKKLTADTFFEQLLQKHGKTVVINDLRPVFIKGDETNDLILAKPKKTKPPRYPKQAQYSGIEGYTRLSFYLDQNGVPFDIEVIESYPQRVFDKASLKAVEKWLFEIPEGFENDQLTYKFEYKMGESYSRKSRRAMRNIKEEALDGNPVSQYFYAKYGAAFLGESDINSTELFYKSALKGVADSQYELGLNLLKGKGCVADKEKGIQWLSKAAAANLGRSQYKLATLYQTLEQEGAAEKAQYWLDKAIATKDPEIAYKLAKHMDAVGTYPSQAILEMLEEATAINISNPLSYFQLLAKTHANLNQFDKAVEFQTEANKMMRRYGKVPHDMQEKLTLYKAKTEG